MARPKILLMALETEWPAPARVPLAMQRAGFEVGIACRARAFLAQTQHRDHFFPLTEKNHGRALLAALETITSAWRPDIILPMDDRTVLFLTRVHERLAAEGDPAGLGVLLRRSLGNPVSTKEALSKWQTAETARKLGIRIPASRIVESADQTMGFVREHGFPVVLKRSFGNGGHDVFICRDEVETKKVLEELQQERTYKAQLLIWREQLRGRMMNASWLSHDRTTMASQFIKGKCATSLAAVVEGKMLAILTAEVEQTYLDSKGPASVVKLVGNGEMWRVAAAMLKHWGLTGLIGFDFILDETGQAWLLECNARSTPLSHLGAKVGNDLCAALLRGLTSASPASDTPAPKELLVAHFPQEMWRSQESPYLKQAFHDVPLEDPPLLEAFKKTPPQRRQPV